MIANEMKYHISCIKCCIEQDYKLICCANLQSIFDLGHTNYHTLFFLYCLEKGELFTSLLQVKWKLDYDSWFSQLNLSMVMFRLKWCSSKDGQTTRQLAAPQYKQEGRSIVSQAVKLLDCLAIMKPVTADRASQVSTLASNEVCSLIMN